MRNAGAVVHLPDGRAFTFPVEGRSLRYPLMTAVDQSGDVALRFRRPGGPRYEYVLGSQVVIEPGRAVTTELLCVLAVSTAFLATYFLGGPG